MAAGYIDLFIGQNESFNTALVLTDATGTPINLAFCIVTSSMKKSYITSNVAAQFITTIANSPGGVVYLSLTRQTTANLIPKRYVFDVMVLDTITDASNRIIEGTVYLTPGVSTLT